MTVAGVFGMLAGVVASAIESIGDYYACAQIAGAHADQMARVAELLEAECELDFVDVNLGCPLDSINASGDRSHD